MEILTSFYFFVAVKNKIIYRKRALIVVQKTVRGYLTRKKYGPRIKVLSKIKNLNGNLKKMEAIAGQLKKEKESTTNDINKLKNEIVATMDKIKVGCDYRKTQSNVSCYRKMGRFNLLLLTPFTPK